MEYNTLRKKLIIPEYGRHIHEMVYHCKKIKDKDDRNRYAKIIIDVMGELNPHLRDVPDFQHKLWDQLFIMADFDIDIESPFSIPTKKETIYSKPNKVHYPENIIKYRYYGNNIRKMIDVACTWEQGEKLDGLSLAIANHMKKCYLTWNKDSVDDAVIFNHLLELSNSKIDLRNKNQSLTSLDRTAKSHTAKSNTNQQRQNTHSRNNNRKK